MNLENLRKGVLRSLTDVDLYETLIDAHRNYNNPWEDPLEHFATQDDLVAECMRRLFLEHILTKFKNEAIRIQSPQE